jgi:hypothetical protein
MSSPWWVKLPLLFLAALLLTLTPLAYADPPDPTWVLGVWDDDDFDDVVGLITSATALVQTPVTCALHIPCPEVLKPARFRASAFSAPRPTSSPRAPPAS